MPGDVPISENAISTADTIAFLKRCQAAIDGRALRCIERRYTIKAPPMEPEEARTEGLRFESTWLSVRAGRNYRLERTSLSARKESPWAQQQPVVMTWDGMEARSKTDDPKHWRGFSGVIDAAPPLVHYLSFVLTWQGWWIFHHDQQSGFVDWLAETSPGELSANGETIWRAAVPKRSDAEIRIAARRVDGEIRPTWAEFNAFQSHEKNRRLVNHCRIAFGPPSAQLGNLLSASAVIHHKLYSAEWEAWSLTSIELGSVDTYATDDSTFRVAFEPGTRVHDMRTGAEYVAGAVTRA